MPERIELAVVPAAGLGTRMAPATWAAPKELMPVGPAPMIQSALEEIEEAGIPTAAVVVSRAKPMLRAFLRRWAEGRSIRLRLVDQPRPAGLADALTRVRGLAADRPLALSLPDNVFFPRGSAPGAMAQTIEAFRAVGCDTCGLIRVRPEHARLYSHAGLVEPERRPRGPTRIERLYGKKSGPLRIAAPAYKTFGRAVLLPHFFYLLERTIADRRCADEVAALQSLVKMRSLYGVLLRGRGFDAGNPDGYSAAVVFWARRRAHSNNP